MAGRRIGLAAFFAVAMSQILLYPVFRAWILDVSDECIRTPEEIGHLDRSIICQVITSILVILALWLYRHVMMTNMS